VGDINKEIDIVSSRSREVQGGKEQKRKRKKKHMITSFFVSIKKKFAGEKNQKAWGRTVQTR